MKPSKPQKAPKVSVVSPKKNFMRESLPPKKGKSPMAPASRKKLSK